MKAPIFILGTPRSGTTLTAQILNRHSRVFIAGETHFFDDIYSLRTNKEDVCSDSSMEKIVDSLISIYSRHNEIPDQDRLDKVLSENPGAFDTLRSSCKNYGDVLKYFMEIQMKHEGKSRWGNSLPRDIFNVDDILHLFPDAKIVVCMRDSRDFLLSYKYKWRATTPDRVEELKRMYHPVVTSFLWKSSMKLVPKIKSMVSEENLFVSRYEDLVQGPVETVKQICSVIEEEYEPDMIEVDSDNSSFQVGGRGIFSTSVGRWKAHLPKEEAYVNQKINHKEMRDLGYSCVKIQANPLKVLNILVSTPYGFWRALKVGRGRRGPLLRYIKRRLRSLFHKKVERKA